MRHAALVGATASGKSALAMALARALPDLEVVAVDALQVYRGMDVGTAKPTAAERAEVAHHGLDLVEPHEAFTVVSYRAAAAEALAGIEGRGHRALFVAGTGLYLRAVVDGLTPPGRYPEARAELEAEPDTGALHARLVGLDPVAAGRMEPSNRRRVVRALEVTMGSGRPFSSWGPGLDVYPPSPVQLLGVRLPRPVVAERITARYRAQLAAGFLDEVDALARRPEGLSPTAAGALGYAELAAHRRGELTLDEALDRAVARTRRYAVRQDRWYRRDPRIRWYDADREPMVHFDALLRDLTACG